MSSEKHDSATVDCQDCTSFSEHQVACLFLQDHLYVNRKFVSSIFWKIISKYHVIIICQIQQNIASKIQHFVEFDSFESKIQHFSEFVENEQTDKN